MCQLVMGGGEEGLLQVANKAHPADADGVVTVGRGAVQDAGKLIRLWLSTKGSNTATNVSTQGIHASSNHNPMPTLAPQIAILNLLAMAEATIVAGLTTTSKTKSGVVHKSMMPTVIIYDPALSAGLPNWVQFGTALQGAEHAVGAMTHPKSNEDICTRALARLSIINDSLKKLVSNPECPTIPSNI